MGELPSSGVVGAVQARELLTQAADLRRVTRRPAGLWPPLVIFGAVTAADAPLSALGPLAASLWWFLAAPAAFAAVAKCSSWQARRRGIEAPSRWLLVAGMAGFAACWFACFWIAAVEHLPIGLGWAIIVGASYLAWSWVSRSLPAAIIAGALAAAGAALALSPTPGWTVQLGVGAVMIIGGLVLRYGPEAS